MRTALLLLLLCLPATAQTRLDEEARQFRATYIASVEALQTSLRNRMPLYEASVKRSEARLARVEKEVAENLMPKSAVGRAQQELEKERANLARVTSDLELTEKELAAVADEKKFIDEYKRAARGFKRSRSKACSNWDVLISQRQTANSLTFTYKIVCR